MTQAQFFQAVADGLAGPEGAGSRGIHGGRGGRDEAAEGRGEDPARRPRRVKLVDRKARIGRNPMTGEQIKIPARSAIKLAPAKALKDIFNKKAKK